MISIKIQPSKKKPRPKICIEPFIQTIYMKQLIGILAFFALSLGARAQDSTTTHDSGPWDIYHDETGKK